MQYAIDKNSFKKIVRKIKSLFSRNTKIKILFFFNKNNISLIEIYEYILIQIYKGKKQINQQIKEIQCLDQYYIVYFKNIQTPLYYPKSFNLLFLAQIILEVFGSIDWHKYEKMGTFVQPKDNVVDCGAAEGLFSLTIKERCKHIYVIEPLPLYVSALKNTFQESKNIDIIQVGLSNKEDTLYIHDNNVASFIDHNPENGIPIHITTLDHLFYNKNIPVNYIKADIEGFELQMLEGAKNTIIKNKPRIAITTYHKIEDYKNIKFFLESLNLDYIIDKKGIEHNGAPVMLHAYVPGY